MHRFFLPPERWPAADSGEGAAGGREVVLDGDEGHHAARVLRLREGEAVILLDGAGRLGEATVLRVDKRSLHLRLDTTTTPPPPGLPCLLALGFSKALRRSWILEKAVELGCTGVWCWRAVRSQGKPPEDMAETWRGPLLSAAKQCGAAWLPELRPLPGGLERLLEELRTACPDVRPVALWEDQAAPAMLSLEMLRDPAPLCFILGPEGGFAPEELRMLVEAGVPAASLGPSVLRWETAALSALSLRCWARGLR